MGDVIGFNEKKKEYRTESEQEGRISIKAPTLEEIKLLNKAAEQYGHDEMVDFNLWNGSCWKALVEQFVKPVAEEIQADPWDVFAVFMAKLHGAVFEEEKSSK